MINHLIFFIYIFIFIYSTIGYGYLFSRLVNRELIYYNVGLQGIFGFFFLTLISILTSFFAAHGYLHNGILHLVGIISFWIIAPRKNFKYQKNLLLMTLVLLLGTYVFKNHDDFPYYHLTYALNLSENGFIVGMGNFSHGFRTFSSLFYFHSILYLPLIKFYLFHIGPFLILLFFNMIFLDRFYSSIKKNKLDISYYFLLLSFIFVNIVFYRIGEHGTDRSAQILLILIFLFFLEILYLQKNKKEILLSFYALLIIIFLASSMKVIYYLYLILIPIILYKKNLIGIFLKKQHFLIISFLSISIFLNLITNYLNTGCFLYPAGKSCLIQSEWSIPKDEVVSMGIHYEWWAKAGGGPNYSSEIPKDVYIKNFNWIENWIDRHFFNKVSDTILGIISICLISYFLFYFSSRKKKNKKYKSYYLAYIFAIIFLTEWFLNHPSMRYGGFVLFAIPLFIFTASRIEYLNISKKKISLHSIFLIFLTLLIFNSRNIIRINKEIDIYNYNVFESPFFYIENVSTKKIISSDKFSVYSTGSKMCWASKTPCSNSLSISAGKFLWMDMVYKK